MLIDFEDIFQMARHRGYSKFSISLKNSLLSNLHPYMSSSTRDLASLDFDFLVVIRLERTGLMDLKVKFTWKGGKQEFIYALPTNGNSERPIQEKWYRPIPNIRPQTAEYSADSSTEYLALKCRFLTKIPLFFYHFFFGNENWI